MRRFLLAFGRGFIESRPGKLLAYWSLCFLIGCDECFRRDGPRLEDLRTAKALHRELYGGKAAG